VRATRAVLAAVGGALAGVAAAALLRPARVPPELRREMLEAAERFALACVETADLVDEAITSQKTGDAGMNELVDRAEQAVNALEPKIVRIGLVFGQNSRAHRRAIDSSLGLRIVLGHLRGELGLSPEEARPAFGQSGNSFLTFKEVANAEIRRAYLPWRTRFGR
jgi:hypothetical protein